MIKIGDTIVKRINTGTASEPNYDAIRFIKGPDGKMVFASVNQTTLEWKNLHLMEDEGMTYPYYFESSTDGDMVSYSAARIEVTKVPDRGADTSLTLQMAFQSLPQSISKFSVNGIEYLADYIYMTLRKQGGAAQDLLWIDVGRGNSPFDKSINDERYVVGYSTDKKLNASLYLINNPASDKYGQEYAIACVLENVTSSGKQVVWKYLYENAIFNPEHFEYRTEQQSGPITFRYPRIKISKSGTSGSNYVFNYNLLLGGDLVGYRNMAQLKDLGGTALSPDYTYDYGLSNIQLTT